MKKTLVALLLLTTGLATYFYVRLMKTNTRNRIIASATTTEIEHSNFILRDRCDLTYNNVQNELADPYNHSEAARWAPNVHDIKIITKAIYSYVDSLKARQKKAKGHWSVYDSGEAGRLYDSLVRYKAAYLGTFDRLPPTADQVIKNMKEMKAQSEKRMLPVLREKISQDWAAYNFKDISAEAVTLRLTEIQSEILRAEMAAAQYFAKQIGDRRGDIIFEPYWFAALNSQVLRKGHKLEALVYYFHMNYYRINPEIRINGIVQKLSEDRDRVDYSQEVTTIGKHELKITIECLLPDSTKKTITKSLPYEVVP